MCEAWSAPCGRTSQPATCTWSSAARRTGTSSRHSMRWCCQPPCNATRRPPRWPACWACNWTSTASSGQARSARARPRGRAWWSAARRPAPRTSRTRSPRPRRRRPCSARTCRRPGSVVRRLPSIRWSATYRPSRRGSACSCATAATTSPEWWTSSRWSSSPGRCPGWLTPSGACTPARPKDWP